MSGVAFSILSVAFMAHLRRQAVEQGWGVVGCGRTGIDHIEPHQLAVHGG